VPEDTTSAPPLAPVRLIVLVMIAGQVMFGAVSLILAPIQPDPDGMEQILLIALATLVIAALMASLVLGAVVVAPLRRDTQKSSDPQAVFGAFNTLTLIRAALYEGFGLFGVVVYLLVAGKPALAAPALAVILLVLGMPTQEKFHRFRGSISNTNPYAG
jgi:hypothetical protein